MILDALMTFSGISLIFGPLTALSTLVVPCTPLIFNGFWMPKSIFASPTWRFLPQTALLHASALNPYLPCFDSTKIQF